MMMLAPGKRFTSCLRHQSMTTRGSFVLEVWIQAEIQGIAALASNIAAIAGTLFNIPAFRQVSLIPGLIPWYAEQ